MYRRQSYYRREQFVRYLFLVVIKYVPWCVVFICVVIKCPLSSKDRLIEEPKDNITCICAFSVKISIQQ
jgi:hypothetical protein